MRDFRTRRNGPLTRCFANRRRPPPGRSPGADVPLAIGIALGDDRRCLSEETMAKGILIAVMDFAAAPEDEFHDWYDLEHVPERLRVPGFLNADRWIGIAEPKVSVATYDLDSVGILHSPPYLAVGGDNASPWTRRTAKFRKSILRYEGEQLFPGDVTAPKDAAALFLIGMNVASEHEPEFNEWYNTEHIPALGAVPGVLCARRYRGTGGTQRYVALYHLAAAEVIHSDGWRKAADTPWTQKLRPYFRDHLRIECRRYRRGG
jgi:hypothetical protein